MVGRSCPPRCGPRRSCCGRCSSAPATGSRRAKNPLLLPRRPHHQDHERTGLHGGPRLSTAPARRIPPWEDRACASSDRGPSSWRPACVATVWTIANLPGAVSRATASVPSRQLAKMSPSNCVASTPAPIGRSASTLPSSALMTISFCGLRQPTNRRRFAGSIDMPTGEPPGAVGHLWMTFIVLESITATWSLSTRLT